jgi:regulator of replication initiation timing
VPDNYPLSYWRDRADEAHAKVDQMVSENGKRWMLEIARLYDRLADESAKREAKKKKGEDPDRGSRTIEPLYRARRVLGLWCEAYSSHRPAMPR